MILAAGSCGKRVPGPSNSAPGAPAVSWIVMTGDVENPDRDYACQSSPRDECVVPASRPDAPTYSHVYLYFHPAKDVVTYTGTIRIGFFEGSGAAQEVQPKITVKPGDRLGNVTVMGIVTRTPGTYPIVFDVAATPASEPAEQIRDEVSVVVK